jgi:xanthine dehydrogenase YagS FAD-binding subunit
MKAFANVNPRSLDEAVSLLKQNAQQGKSAAIVGGGSDLLGMVKERLISPDVLVNLKAIKGLDRVAEQGGVVKIGGLISLDSLSQHPLIRARYKVLADAAHAVATPQIRNAGTLAGNVCQRPWCWYLRNGFPCYKNGGNQCFSVTGENQFHAIFGGGPSFIVHPSDTAPALVALGAKFRIAGGSGARTLNAGEFFALPSKNAAKENVLANDEILAEVHLPAAPKGLKSGYHKEMDRESWTHAVVSVAVAMEMEGDTCKNARVVLGGVAPIPWRLPKVEAMLAGQRITPELSARAGEAAVEGAQPLAKNKYKLPITKAIVKRTLSAVAAA